MPCLLSPSGDGGVPGRHGRPGPRLASDLEGEITDHLGYDKRDPAGKNGGNSRNGTRSKCGY